MRTLYIGNKNYSSWSMRPWVLLKQAGIPFEEVMVRFDSFSADSQFKQRLGPISPAGKVPVLVDDGFPIWDSLAIAEYLAEQFPERQLWPREPRARARARSVSAEMHAGFQQLRGACMMNIEADLAHVGALAWRDKPGVRSDVERLVQMWTELLDDHQGPMLFGEFSIADAMFAPVVMRLTRYALPVPAHIAAYLQRVQELPGVAAWVEGALQERDFLAFEEPFRLSR